MFLANNPEHASAKEICDSLHMKSGIVSVHIDRLVEDGYLTRETSHADRRLISLRVTSKATHIKLTGQALQKQFLSDAFAGMSEEELAAFHQSIEKIVDNLQGMKG